MKMSVEVTLTQNERLVRQGLLQPLFSASMKSCKYLGITIFSLNSRGALHFKYCSLPFILTNLRFVSIILLAIYFPYAGDQFELVYPEQSKTETVSQTILAGNMFLGDALYTFLTFLNRSKIISFHKNLAEFLIEAVGPLTEAERQVVISVVPRALKFFTRYKWIIYSAFYYSTGSGLLKAFYVIFTAGKPWLWWSHSLIGLPLFFLSYGVASTFRLLPRLLMITILHTFRLCPKILTMQLEKVKRRGFVTKEEIHRIISYFRKQEILTSQLNDAFGWCFAVDMLLMVLSLITTLFSVVVCLAVKEYLGAFSFGSTLILHTAIVFELCNASYAFEVESKKSATLLKSIPIYNSGVQIIMLHAKLLSLPLAIKPGSFFYVNRGTLTGIVGAITTYVVVLFQFHIAENSQSAN